MFPFAGKPPLVIARGGLSGVFPDSSDIAYKLALFFSLPSVILWCDVQLTKDGAGVCLPDLRLNNGTNVEWILGDPPNTTYLVDGVATKGWFTVDFTLNDLSSNFRREFKFSWIAIFYPFPFILHTDIHIHLPS